MFDTLMSLTERPDAFCRYTAPELWTRPHIANQMLNYHIDGQHDVASRRAASITSITDWLADRFDLSDKAVCDLGCGPGLYAARLAEKGARVTGLDISATSIDYARQTYGQDAGAPRFALANYLEDPLPGEQDLVLLIYADYCALSPAQRRSLLAKMKAQLKPGGHIVFDVFSERFFDTREASLVIEKDLMGGFWAPSPYVGLQRCWLYEGEKLVLDHYLIVEQTGSFEIFNWLQYFSPQSLMAELLDLGFKDIELINILTGAALESDYGMDFGVVLSA
ncbi:methyltransferase domain-containing protein [uncultured Cohaesibacter sp.]|uniref:class I SAM-dependent methyltransferase n=1 Tax=uncultured Cohaesibacter sp. TaxID=1002546 RepID=UPI0029316B7B|nr:methyltransferase domain-containing protein [uncultured Cohaesibacter sp.]